MKTSAKNFVERASEGNPIWVFTPSRTSPDDLEAILVQRHQLLKDAVERVRESALTDHKHHLLFVGPRGCGKTHLVTLIVSRLGEDYELADRLRIAWLNEDETCTTLIELLLRIHVALEKRYPDEFRKATSAAAYDMKPEAALEFLSKQILAALGSRTLLVVAENLDAIFEGLGDSGQKQLRAFIQENPRLSIVATAQRLVENLSDRTSPFFGFFQIEHLKPLNVQEATELLQNIARLRDEPKVVAFLTTSRGRSRVRALHHLSGGNHRIYIVLSQFINRDSIDALVGPFMEMVDELTPYYQERIRWLPPMQRKIVEYLCACETTVPVKEIAKRLFASPASVSSQLQDLREKGYVEASQRGRESLYEISEPLMRICIEVKDNQSHQPLRLLVDFLRVWYDDHELTRRLGRLDTVVASRAYLESAIERNKAEGNLRKLLFLEDLRMALPEEMDVTMREGLLQECVDSPEAYALAAKSLADGNEDEALSCLDEAIGEEPDPSGKAKLLLLRAQLHDLHQNRGREIEDYTAIIGLSGAPAGPLATAFLNRGVTYGEMGDRERPIDDYRTVIGLPGAPAEQVAKALYNRGVTYGQAGDGEREIEDYTTVIELPDAPAEQVAMALFNRGVIYRQAGDREREIEDYTAVIKLPSAPAQQVAKALYNRGVTYGQAGDREREIEDYTALIKLPGATIAHVAKALLNRGTVYGQAGDRGREIEDYTTVIGLPGAPKEQVAMALFNRGLTYRQVGDRESEIEDYAAVIGLPDAPAEPLAKALFNRGVSYGETGDREREIEDYTAVIGLPDAPVEWVAKALINRGVTYGEIGDSKREIDDYTIVIGLSDAPAEQVAKALFNRAVTYGAAGDKEREIEDFTAVSRLPDAPMEQVASALHYRGIIFSRMNRADDSRKDFETLVHLPNAPAKTVVDANMALSELHCGEGRWSEGLDALDAGLVCGAKEEPPCLGTASGVIRVVFSAGLSPEARLEKVIRLFAIYGSHNALSVLGEGLVSHVGDLFRAGEPFPSVDNLEQWASAWEKAGEGVDDFRLSLRLLRTGIEFVKAGGNDPGILLGLTAPERQILKQAFGMEEKNPDKPQ